MILFLFQPVTSFVVHNNFSMTSNLQHCFFLNREWIIYHYYIQGDHIVWTFKVKHGVENCSTIIFLLFVSSSLKCQSYCQVTRLCACQSYFSYTIKDIKTSNTQNLLCIQVIFLNDFHKIFTWIGQIKFLTEWSSCN